MLFDGTVNLPWLSINYIKKEEIEEKRAWEPQGLFCQQTH